jgi:tRNA pseudouridine13 synthase
VTHLPRARLKERPEDFVVEELPAYEPAGTGTHVYVRFTKTDRTTLDAVKTIARALSCEARAAGFAGMKDRRAVTTQTISLEAPRGVDPQDLARRARDLTLEGITVHAATPHGNKLKPGHLAGNRFAIALRGVATDRVGEVTGALERIGRDGVPNAFGAQRFGVGGDNAERALAWLRGRERPPRDPRIQRLLWSSLQSAVFNAVLGERVGDGSWASAIEGDLLKVRASGGLFVCADVQTDRVRSATGEVSPTGPIIGARMRWPEGAAAALERRVADATLGEDFDLGKTRALGEGSRRALRLWVDELRWEAHAEGGPHADGANNRNPVGTATTCVRVYFVLPKGAYATTVLGAAVTLEEGTAREDTGDALDPGNGQREDET